MTAAAHSLAHALNGELDGNHDHVQMHEVASSDRVRHKPNLAWAREHGLRNEGLPSSDPLAALRLCNLCSLVRVRGRLFKPLRGRDLVGLMNGSRMAGIRTSCT